MKLSAASNARPLVLFVAFVYGLATLQSAVWVAAAVLALAEGFWWAASYRSPEGKPLHPALVIASALLAWPIGALRWGAWVLCLSAEWILRPALWDGGIMTHARRRRAARKGRKIRGHAAHAENPADVLALAAHAARVETAEKPRRRWGRKLPPPPAPVPASAEVQAAEKAVAPEPVGMRFASGVLHVMADGSARFEELAREA